MTFGAISGDISPLRILRNLEPKEPSPVLREFSLDLGEEYVQPPPSEEKRPKLVTAKEPVELIDDEVRSIYLSYPRRVDPADAYRAIRAAHSKLVKGNTILAPDGTKVAKMSREHALVLLQAKAKRYGVVMQGKDQKFIPYPATWFNKARYLCTDEVWRDSQETETPTAAPRDVMAEHRARKAAGR